MLSKNSIVLCFTLDEEHMTTQVIKQYESEGWRLVLDKELVGDNTTAPYSWMLGFAKHQEIDLPKA